MSSTPPVAPGRVDEWDLLRRLGFRFLFVYALLYFFPQPLTTIPGTAPVWRAYESAWAALVRWFDEHLFHVGIPPGTTFTGSGDRLFDYVAVMVVALLAAVVAMAWTALDRRGRDHRRLAEGLWIWVRVVLAATMILYGVAKVLPGQFGEPSSARLAQPIGESSPMGLLWTFMGSSRAYSAFAGGLEVLGGLLLMSRRTTTLGAMVVAGVMTNVVALNLCYDVPVKLYSMHLLVTAVLLMRADLGRLIAMLVLNRAVAPRPPRRPWPQAWMERARRPLLAALTLWLVAVAVDQELGRPDPAVLPAAYRGSLVVEAFTADGGPGSDAVRWRRLDGGHGRWVVLRTVDGAATRVHLTVTPDGRALTLRIGDEVARLAATWVAPDVVELSGRYRGVEVLARLRALGREHWLLVRRGFRWVNEEPFNR